VQVDGDALTALQLIDNIVQVEDATHNTGDSGVMPLAVRNDTLAALAGTDGDYAPLQVNANGALYIQEGAALDVSAATVTVTGTVTANLSATDNAVLDSIDSAVNGTLTVGAHAVTNAGTFVVQEDGAALTALQLLDNALVAHDAAVSGSTGVSVTGFEARSTEPTAVADADATRGIATLLGKQVTAPYAIPASSWSYAAASGGITNTTGVTAKAAAGAGIRNYITRVQVINGHASVGTDVQIRDGAAGTVLWRGWAESAGGGAAAVFDPPLRGTANTLVEVACGTTGTATYFNLQGFVAAE
jgi:hypothetical protein